MSDAPLQYLSAAGERAHAVVPLTWYMLIISVLVSCIVGLLLWMSVRRASQFRPDAILAVERGGDGIAWIRWGLAASALPLLVALVWTMAALGHVAGPTRRADMVIDVTPRQWWWDIRYSGDTPADTFEAANEIHIPTGTRVRVRLHGADVIHSFWVPQLSGKTDAIPGQVNQSWIAADRPGRFQGQCAEFCGMEHARMAFEVVADTPKGYARWRTAQLQTAPPPATSAQLRGQTLFQYRCALCHAVRGTRAASHYGPDLTHLKSRRLIAGGMLPNNRGSLAGWVEAPQALKPGALMPDQKLGGQDLNDVLAYLETLK